MEKKQKIFTKETIIACILGLVIGIGGTLLVSYLSNNNKIATVAGKSIKTKEITDKLILTDGFRNILNETDKIIFGKMYTLTEDEEKNVEEDVDYYIDLYEGRGYTQEEFLRDNGYKNLEEFKDDIRLSVLQNKYAHDYLESKLEPGAVEEYYNENKDSLQEYDSEHILVEITADVKDADALALANEIIAKLDEGKTFDEVVEEYGDRIIHEDLGLMANDGSLEQSYMDELMALEDGAYSRTPVKTSYGYHIVHRLGTSTFEDVRYDIIEILSEDILSEDSNLLYKALIKLREENNFKILNEDVANQYKKYCDSLNES